MDSILTGKYHNQAAQGAESTLSALLGRMAVYSGREVTWDEMLASDQYYDPELEGLDLSQFNQRVPCRKLGIAPQVPPPVGKLALSPLGVRVPRTGAFVAGVGRVRGSRLPVRVGKQPIPETNDYGNHRCR